MVILQNTLLTWFFFFLFFIFVFFFKHKKSLEKWNLTSQSKARVVCTTCAREWTEVTWHSASDTCQQTQWECHHDCKVHTCVSIYRTRSDLRKKDSVINVFFLPLLAAGDTVLRWRQEVPSGVSRCQLQPARWRSTRHCCPSRLTILYSGEVSIDVTQYISENNRERKKQVIN